MPRSWFFFNFQDLVFQVLVSFIPPGIGLVGLLFVGGLAFPGLGVFFPGLACPGLGLMIFSRTWVSRSWFRLFF